MTQKRKKKEKKQIKLKRTIFFGSAHVYWLVRHKGQQGTSHKTATIQSGCWFPGVPSSLQMAHSDIQSGGGYYLEEVSLFGVLTASL